MNSQETGNIQVEAETEAGAEEGNAEEEEPATKDARLFMV